MGVRILLFIISILILSSVLGLIIGLVKKNDLIIRYSILVLAIVLFYVALIVYLSWSNLKYSEFDW